MEAPKNGGKFRFSSPNISIDNFGCYNCNHRFNKQSWEITNEWLSNSWSHHNCMVCGWTDFKVKSTRIFNLWTWFRFFLNLNFKKFVRRIVALTPPVFFVKWYNIIDFIVVLVTFIIGKVIIHISGITKWHLIIIYSQNFHYSFEISRTNL